MIQSILILRARLMILGAGLLWSFGGLGIKMCEFGPWRLACLRAGFSALFILLVFPRARRAWNWKILATGAATGCLIVLFVWSNKSTTAADAIFLQYTFPLWVLLLAPALLKEPVTGRDVLMLLVFGTGLALCFFAPQPSTSLSPNILLGNILGLAGGFAAGLSVIGFASLRGGGGEAAIVCANLLACAVCVGPAIWAESAGAAPWSSGRDWLIVGLLGVFQVGLAFWLYVRGLRRLRAMEASLLELVEPALNPVWVFLVFPQERPAPLVWLGGAIILGGMVYQTLRRRGPELAAVGHCTGELV